MISPSELQANDHTSKLRLRCLLPHQPQTRTQWMEEHQDRPLWWRLKFAPPAAD
jgi:hypothetical protein